MFAGKAIRLLFFLLLLSTLCFGQKKTKAQLQQERKANQEKIAETEKILKETSAKKQNSIGELNALNHRIKQQERLIQGIKSEINLLDGEIRENQDIIMVLEEDLEVLKKEFAEMLYQAQKTQNSISHLTFIFSAKSLDEMLTRMRYVQQYTEARKLQAEEIQKVQEELLSQVDLITEQKDTKTKLLDVQVVENANLNQLKVKQGSVISSLAKEETQLRADIERTKRANAALDKKIDEIIKEEMSLTASKSANVALSASFVDNRTKFSWPVSGFVSLPFGRQPHPALPHVIVDNSGVTIQTTENEKVKCIFEGEVRAIAVVPTFGNSVIISHGDYMSVYVGLKEVYVKKGQKVNTQDDIGLVRTNGEGVSELNFRIYKNTTPLDPEKWLRNL